MANVLIVGKGFSIASADTFILPASAPNNVGTKVIQIVSASFVGSLTVKARVTGSGNTPVAVSYRKRYLNGAVADETNVSTAITTDSLIEVNAAGVDVVLDCTAFTSGSAAVRTWDLVDR